MLGNVHPPTACPPEPALRARLEERWKPSPANVEIAGCTPGRFGRPGWLVIAYLDTYEEGDEPGMPSSSMLRRIVLDPDGVIAESEPESVAPWYRAEGGGPGAVQLVDFDGDGTDEILETHDASHGGSSSRTLVVRRVESPAIRELFSREIGADNLAADSDQPIEWSSEVEVKPLPAGRGHELVLTTSWSQGKPSGPEDLAPGKHVYRLTNGTFAEHPK